MKRLACIVALCAAIGGCSTPPQAAQWGQGQETPQGYMEPEHSFYYYYFMYHVLWSNPQPVYHVYIPPPGYDRSYRPWYTDRDRYYRPRDVPPTSNPVAPVAQPAKPMQPAPRSTGGFSQPPAPKTQAAPRSSGGFAPPKPAPAAPRSSGGFSSSKRK